MQIDTKLLWSFFPEGCSIQMLQNLPLCWKSLLNNSILKWIQTTGIFQQFSSTTDITTQIKPLQQLQENLLSLSLSWCISPHVCCMSCCCIVVQCGSLRCFKFGRNRSFKDARSSEDFRHNPVLSLTQRPWWCQPYLHHQTKHPPYKTCKSAFLEEVLKQRALGKLSTLTMCIATTSKYFFQVHGQKNRRKDDKGRQLKHSRRAKIRFHKEMQCLLCDSGETHTGGEHTAPCNACNIKVIKVKRFICKRHESHYYQTIHERFSLWNRKKNAGSGKPTSSPMLQALVSSCAMNLEVLLTSFGYFGCCHSRCTATTTDFVILFDTTFPTTVFIAPPLLLLLLILSLSLSACWTPFCSQTLNPDPWTLTPEFCVDQNRTTTRLQRCCWWSPDH